MVAILSEILEKTSELKQLKEKREEILDRLRSPSRSSYDGVSDHSRESRVERLYVKADELEQQIVDKTFELIELKTRTSFLMMDRLKSEDEWTVLIMRYFKGCKWVDIAAEIGKPMRQTFKIHRHALQELENPGIIERNSNLSK